MTYFYSFVACCVPFSTDRVQLVFSLSKLSFPLVLLPSQNKAGQLLLFQNLLAVDSIFTEQITVLPEDQTHLLIMFTLVPGLQLLVAFLLSGCRNICILLLFVFFKDILKPYTSFRSSLR